MSQSKYNEGPSAQGSDGPQIGSKNFEAGKCTGKRNFSSIILCNPEPCAVQGITEKMSFTVVRICKGQ